MKKQIFSVDQYISEFAYDVQKNLKLIRNAIRENAPGAVESISYGMPAYKLNGKPLVYFGAFANHIGFYATPNGHEKFASQLSLYKRGKGSVQFPSDEELPIDLIIAMVKFKVSENLNL
jgi:uncharacterized protein YdhG (YjbR/CyaY superfamily)